MSCPSAPRAPVRPCMISETEILPRPVVVAGTAIDLDELLQQKFVCSHNGSPCLTICDISETTAHFAFGKRTMLKLGEQSVNSISDTLPQIVPCIFVLSTIWYEQQSYWMIMRSNPVDTHAQHKRPLRSKLWKFHHLALEEPTWNSAPGQSRITSNRWSGLWKLYSIGYQCRHRYKPFGKNRDDNRCPDRCAA